MTDATTRGAQTGGAQTGGAQMNDPRPRLPGPAGSGAVDAPVVLEAHGVTVAYDVAGREIRAVDGVSLELRQGEICALVGESGCGKSTLAYALVDLVSPPGRIVSGEVRLRGRSLQTLGRKQLRRVRGAEVGMVFQAALNAFNPVITIGRHVEHVLDAHPEAFASALDGRRYFAELLELVRLRPEQIWTSYAGQLSGGMRQRVALALALVLRPPIVVLDEPTTALDVINQRLVVEVLQDLHERLGLTVLFVTHDLAVVAELADRVAVMYAGRLVESGPVEEIFAHGRRHPYLAALVAAIPSVLEGGLEVRPIPGHVPVSGEQPPGCRFAPRCELARDLCRRLEPRLVRDATGHAVACHAVQHPAGPEREDAPWL